MLAQVRVQRDKAVVPIPRWADTLTTVTFTNCAGTAILQTAPSSP